MSFWSTKTCTSCGETKPLGGFSRDSRTKDGRNGHCTPCRSARARARRAANPDRYREDMRAWREANPERYREHSARGRLKRYGLTSETYEAMIRLQGGRCAACRTTDPGADRGWNIDHDHACCDRPGSCGLCIRGLLCSGCNIALGAARDDPARLRALAEYLLERSPA